MVQERCWFWCVNFQKFWKRSFCSAEGRDGSMANWFEWISCVNPNVGPVHQKHFPKYAQSFFRDEKALELSLVCHDKGYLQHYNPAYLQFMLMPMMHSEDIAIQDQSLTLFKEFTSERIYEYAIRHQDIVQRFGRFPHRNQILGRISTEEGIEFLKQPGSSF